MGLSPYSWLVKLATNRQFRKWLIAVGPVATKAFTRYLAEMRHRESAIRQADEIRGEFSIATIDGERHVIVWRDGKPLSAFPPVKGDLEEKLRFFDRERLKRPEDLRRRQAQRWLQERRGTQDPPSRTPTQRP
ncbi:MAG: hypothetical protein M3198_12915 [Actinomycetota bacterium]|nr:hypothetical protein [Actinomycetota bacterium]